MKEKGDTLMAKRHVYNKYEIEMIENFK